MRFTESDLSYRFIIHKKEMEPLAPPPFIFQEILMFISYRFPCIPMSYAKGFSVGYGRLLGWL